MKSISKQIKFTSRDQFEDFLKMTPGFRKNTKLFGRKQKVRDGCPKAITDIARDSAAIEAAQYARFVLKYHRRVGAVVRGSLSGKPVKDEIQKKIARSGDAAEVHFQNMIRKASEGLITNKSAHGRWKEIRKHSSEASVFSNPSFFSKEEAYAIKALGISLEEMSYIYEVYCLPRKKLVQSTSTEKLIKQLVSIQKQASSISFPDAPRYLTDAGLLVIGADDNPVETVVGAFLVTAGVLIAPVNPVAGWTLGVIGGGMIIEGITGFPGGVLSPGGSSNKPSKYDARINQHWQTVATRPATPSLSALKAEQALGTYGYLIGNTNRRTMELHIANCPYLHLITNEHKRIFYSVNEAQAHGLDNCHYCLGSSVR